MVMSYFGGQNQVQSTILYLSYTVNGRLHQGEGRGGRGDGGWEGGGVVITTMTVKEIFSHFADR